MSDFRNEMNFGIFGKLKTMIEEKRLVPSRGFWLYVGTVSAFAIPLIVSVSNVMNLEAQRSAKVDTLLSDVQDWKTVPQQIAVMQVQIQELKLKDDFYDSQEPIREQRYEGLLNSIQHENDTLQQHTDAFGQIAKNFDKVDAKIDNLNDAIHGRPSYDTRNRLVK